MGQGIWPALPLQMDREMQHLQEGAGCPGATQNYKSRQPPRRPAPPTQSAPGVEARRAEFLVKSLAPGLGGKPAALLTLGVSRGSSGATGSALGLSAPQSKGKINVDAYRTPSRVIPGLCCEGTRPMTLSPRCGVCTCLGCLALPRRTPPSVLTTGRCVYRHLGCTVLLGGSAGP